ncbi:Polymeric immunoglobulin receptor [Collichthys lucidus]|nr:Polymeric immunoglobulin receptor [Collichthys lucidus]
MNVRHTLICVFFLSLQDENTGLINATTVYGRIEGGFVTVKCSYSESWKFLCRDKCNEKDVLIETNLDKHQSGRYSIKSTAGSLYVTITQLTKSDSGLYRCGSGTTRSTRSSYRLFKIIVVDAKLDGNAPDVTTIYKRPGGNIVVRCFFTNSGDRKYFCKDGCEEKDILVETTGVRVQKDRYSIEFTGSSTAGSLFVGITQLNKSDSGLYRCVLDISLPPNPIRTFNIIVTDPTTSKPPPAFTTPVPSASTLTSTPGVLLYVIVILVIAVIIIMGLALMIMCIQRNNRPDGLKTRGNSDGTNMEVYDYENDPAVHDHEDSTYQSLNPATMDEDQIYSELTHT